MKKILIITSILFFLASCESNPWDPLASALNNAANKLEISWSTSIPEHTGTVSTQLGKTQDQSVPVKSLKIENYNVVLYSGTGKIDTLTTKWTVSSINEGFDIKCNQNGIKDFTFYNILKADGKYGLVEKLYASCGSDPSSSYYIFDFQKWWTLISIDDSMKQYFGITDYRDKNYMMIPSLDIKTSDINDQENSLTLHVPDISPYDDATGWMEFHHISDKLLQSKGLKRDGIIVHIPLQEFFQ